MATTKQPITFADLPYEIREIVWNIDEDSPYYNNSSAIFTPCRLWPTITLNAKPPVIASVCQESREIAFKARTVISSQAAPVNRARHSEKDQHLLDNCLSYRGHPSYRWLDCKRAMPHLYILIEHSWGEEEDPVDTLAMLATLFASTEASVAFELFKKGPEEEIPDEPDQISYEEPVPVIGEEWFGLSNHWWRKDLQQAVQQDSRSLIKCKHWHVVMGTVVVHANAFRAADAGFFGLLGDEPIQIVDLAHQKRIKEYIDFARLCEQATGTKYTQNFDENKHLPLNPDVARRQLEFAMWKSGFETHLYPQMYPAIMFRLCPHACHLHTSQPNDCLITTASDCTPACWLE